MGYEQRSLPRHPSARPHRPNSRHLRIATLLLLLAFRPINITTRRHRRPRETTPTMGLGAGADGRFGREYLGRGRVRVPEGEREGKDGARRDDQKGLIGREEAELRLDGRGPCRPVSSRDPFLFASLSHTKSEITDGPDMTEQMVGPSNARNDARALIARSADSEHGKIARWGLARPNRGQGGHVCLVRKVRTSPLLS